MKKRLEGRRILTMRMHLAYEMLSEPIREFIDGLTAVHDDGSHPFFDPQHGPNTNVVLRASDAGNDLGRLLAKDGYFPAVLVSASYCARHPALAWDFLARRHATTPSMLVSDPLHSLNASPLHAARTVETGHQSKFDRISANSENDRNCCSRGFGGSGAWPQARWRRLPQRCGERDRLPIPARRSIFVCEPSGIRP